MAQVNITRPLMVALTPQDQGLIMRGLSELPAKESRDILNRLESLIIRNEMPEPVQEPQQLKPVSEAVAEKGADQ